MIIKLIALSLLLLSKLALSQAQYQKFDLLAKFLPGSDLEPNISKCLRDSESPYKLDNLFSPITSNHDPRKQRHYKELLAQTHKFRQFVPHTWMSYSGPWIENVWISEFCCDRPLEDFGPYIPIFIQWLDMYYAHNLSESEYTSIIYRFFETLQPNFLYITVSQNNRGLLGTQYEKGRIPANIVIINPTGRGHVPIPHMIRELRWRGPLKPQRKGVFAGNPDSHYIRNMTIKAATAIWGDEFANFRNTKDWINEFRVSRFVFTPRGFARTCFRTFEIIQLGLIPFIIYNDFNLLPYLNSTLDWGNMAFFATAETIDQTLHEMDSLGEDKYRAMIQTIKANRKYFTYKGIMEQIDLFMKKPQECILRCSKYMFELYT